MDVSLGGATHLSEHGEALSQFDISSQCDSSAVQSAKAGFHWYAVQTYPRHEKRVHEDLRIRNIECFLPLYETVHRWRNGCKARVELPLFPGYIFVEIDPQERFRVLEIPGTLSVVGSQREPWPVPDSEISYLRDNLHLHMFEPHAYMAVGQRVRITGGPLVNLTGFLVRKSRGLRVVLALDLIRQAVAVEVDADDVEVIGPVPSPLQSSQSPVSM